MCLPLVGFLPRFSLPPALALALSWSSPGCSSNASDNLRETSRAKDLLPPFALPWASKKSFEKR
eukprot:CAMPEP_0194767044 /NCGR_PEP_ID=MMETSP0323_2-20130528/34275_1 /TAXON_ID=2866 ORGANISM="Crypthecodinium cohnii, Strain Seligo" /NCGR_SAMPLE_ID=MMETSP0323_2 /ASSEMBLY_ACC=CAM_ASM_000346 /LENGTH=63 /DNA_ID=CAMNT_0039698465 /DNA_START=90 /DNA_END=281 /DNA_ORIENTATION=+